MKFSATATLLALAAFVSAAPTRFARDADLPGQPYPTDGCHNLRRQGHVKLVDSTGSDVTYIANSANPAGEYSTTSDPAQFLHAFFTFTSCPGDPYDLTPTNGLEGFAVLGAVSSTDGHDLGVGNHNYAVIAGTQSTGVNAPPAHVGDSFSTATSGSFGSESAIWSFDMTAHTLNPHWTNDDGSKPTVYLGLNAGSLYLTGDKDAFVADKGATTWVTPKLVPF